MSAPPAPRAVALLPEEALAALAARGHEGAFAAFYARHERRLLACCRAIVRDEHDAQDALQAAMLRAWRALRDGQAPRALRPWLYSVARNAALDVLARRRNEVPAVEEETAVLDPGPDERALLDEQVRALLEDVAALSPRRRDALVLREVAGLPTAEVAAILGVSGGAVRQAIFEARLALMEDRAERDAACADIRALLVCAETRRRRRVPRAHLRGCASCRAFAAERAAQRRILAALPDWLTPAAGLGAVLAAGATATPPLLAKALVTAAVVALEADDASAPPHEQRAQVARTRPQPTPAPRTTTEASAPAAAVHTAAPPSTRTATAVRATAPARAVTRERAPAGAWDGSGSRPAGDGSSVPAEWHGGGARREWDGSATADQPRDEAPTYLTRERSAPADCPESADAPDPVEPPDAGAL